MKPIWAGYTKLRYKDTRYEIRDMVTGYAEAPVSIIARPLGRGNDMVVGAWFNR